jgi:hypothetical protein
VYSVSDAFLGGTVLCKPAAMRFVIMNPIRCHVDPPDALNIEKTVSLAEACGGKMLLDIL